jgi:hypothetical protein
MITFNSRPQAPHNAFRAENATDLRVPAFCGAMAEVRCLHVSVIPNGQKVPAKLLADEEPTRLEFAPSIIR